MSYKVFLDHEISLLKTALKSKWRKLLDINAWLHGKPPLHWAVFARSEKRVTLLIKKGADLNTKDNMGRTARTILFFKRLDRFFFTTSTPL